MGFLQASGDIWRALLQWLSIVIGTVTLVAHSIDWVLFRITEVLPWLVSRSHVGKKINLDL